MTDMKTGNQAETMPLGPLDILVLEFPGNNFKGKIMQNLHELVAAGTIRILDLVVITKNQAGHASALELSEQYRRSALSPVARLSPPPPPKVRLIGRGSRRMHRICTGSTFDRSARWG